MSKSTRYAAKACTSKSYRRNSGIAIGILSALSVLAVVMLLISFIGGNILWGIAWLIALILALSYVVIRINTVYPTYLATDKRTVYMKNWTNDFLPYAADSSLKLIREFIPAPTKITEIPIEDISTILIGTKNFIKRYGEDNEYFRDNLRPLEKSKDYYQKKMVQSMDLIYVSTKDNECYYMPIDRFSPRDVSRVLQFIQRANPEAEIRVNSKNFRMSLKKD
ncbi:MAG: hypothetical protein SOS24_03280 [Clostridia bacterium]|nr:hypothetical protein [Clostridia bacterium]